MDEVVREPASAKLNPFLRVLSRRSDGYHEIETLVVPVTLADGVEARTAEATRLAVAGPLAGEVPEGEENLVLRAVRALRARREAALLLVKRIPVGAGLGGGSADAAAALRALDRLWGLGLGVPGLEPYAAEVGSDVPALLHGGPVLARGRGEVVEPVALARTWWVLVTQPLRVAAADAYRWWDADGARGPDPASLLEALGDGDVQRAGGLLSNDLEPGVAARYGPVGGARSRLLEAGALGALMCGSGPTVAGLARDGRHAEDLAAAAGGIVVSAVSGPPPGG